MATVKDILIEMKNLSELMVDLAYSSILFQNEDAAEEVLSLEDRVNSLNYEIKKESLLAARSVEDAEKLTVLLEVAEAAESMANAAKDLADITLNGMEPHPVLKMAMADSETNIYRVSVSSDSDLVNQTLGDLFLSNCTGMRVISIRRNKNWIYGPDKHTMILENDVLIVKGTEAGYEILKKLAHNEITLDDI